MKKKQFKTYSQQELLEAYPNQFELTQSAIRMAYLYLDKEKSFTIESLLKDLRDQLHPNEEE